MDITQYISSGNIEMYVMGLCTPAEKAELETLRPQYPQLNDAVIQFEKELETNLLANAIVPGAAVDTRVLKALSTLQTPVIDINTNSTTPVKKMGWLKAVAAAAILLLAISGIFNYTLYKKTTEQNLALREKQNYSPLPITDYEILKKPSITPIAMNGVFPHNVCRCTMFWDKKTGKVYVMIHHLVPTTPQNNYQLWAMVNDKPVSVGIVNDKVRDRFIELQNMPADATAFIVTMEKSGGNTMPTLENTYLSGKI
jgi:anti-sigma-K factor RskA